MEKNKKEKKNESPQWSIYILKCGDGSFYTGATVNMTNRLGKHRAGKGGAYTRSHRPVSVIYEEKGLTRSEALKREAAIKKLSKGEKQALISKHPRIHT